MVRKTAVFLTIPVLVLAAVTLFSLVPKKVGQGPQATLEVEAKEGWKKEVRSGDGLMKLLGTSRVLPDGRTEYEFQVVDAEGRGWTVLKKVAAAGGGMEIPFNSWSPDNKQFFVLENDGTRINYLVFKANGAAYSSGVGFLNVTEYWLTSKNDFAVRTISGWAGNDLLVVKTDNKDGSKGPSFWFVVSSHGFLRLRS